MAGASSTEIAAPSRVETVAFSLSASPLRRMGGRHEYDTETTPTIADISDLLDQIGEALGLPLWVTQAEVDRDERKMPSVNDCKHVTAVTSLVRRLRLESPLQILVETSPVILKSGSALGLLIYLTKQLWTIDLDLRIRRAESQAKLAEAREIARAASEGAVPASWPEAATAIRETPPQLPDKASTVTWWRGNKATLYDWDLLDWE